MVLWRKLNKEKTFFIKENVILKERKMLSFFILFFFQKHFKKKQKQGEITKHFLIFLLFIFFKKIYEARLLFKISSSLNFLSMILVPIILIVDCLFEIIYEVGFFFNLVLFKLFYLSNFMSIRLIFNYLWNLIIFFQIHSFSTFFIYKILNSMVKH